MNHNDHSQGPDLEALQQQLAEMKDLLANLLPVVNAAQAPSVPADKRITVEELVAKARRLTTSASLRTYQHAWGVLVNGMPARGVPALGARYADQIMASDLEAMKEAFIAEALARNTARDARRSELGRAQLRGDGTAAWYNAVGAFRRLFAIAEADGHVLANPAMKVRKSKVRYASRIAFSQDRVPHVLALAYCGGDDPELDRELTHFHLITGARRAGALALRLMDIDTLACMVTLREKNGTVIAQPVPDWYAAHLRAFALRRGATAPQDQVFRKRRCGGDFTPITKRRYDFLFDRMRASDQWADGVQLTAHLLRHTAATYVERVAGKAVSRAFLRHADGDTTDGYVKATPAEVAAAVIAIWGGRHPLVP